MHSNAFVKTYLTKSYLSLPPEFYTHCIPQPVSNPELVLFNQSLATELGISIAPDAREELNQVFSGNALIANSSPVALAYAGHQFGHFTMLGDGRAILLAELINTDGQPMDIQLKGSGRTPYSRNGDGRAALGPMIREYIVSEAMYALGVPTTRSLAVVSTGESVLRDCVQPGAIVTRVAASHL